MLPTVPSEPESPTSEWPPRSSPLRPAVAEHPQMPDLVTPLGKVTRPYRSSDGHDDGYLCLRTSNSLPSGSARTTQLTSSSWPTLTRRAPRSSSLATSVA